MKTFRNYPFYIFIGIIVALAMFISVPKSSEAAEVVVKFGHIQAPGSPVDKDAHFFSDLVKIKSGGRIDVQVFPASTLGKQMAQVEGCIAGTHDLTYGISSVLAIVKKESYWDLPFLFNDHDAVTKLTMSPLMKQIEMNYMDKGLVLVGFGELGFRQITNNVRPVYLPKDMKGIKNRVAAGPTKMLIFKTYGSNPTPMSMSELYQALKQGVVDGLDNPLSTIEGGKYYEVQKYLSMVGYGYNPLIIVGGKPFWNKIPEWARVILRDCGREAGTVARYKGKYYDAVLEAKLAKQGMQVNHITDEQRAQWLKASQPVYDALTPKIGKQFLQQIIQVVR